MKFVSVAPKSSKMVSKNSLTNYEKSVMNNTVKSAIFLANRRFLC